ncbi:hypothetical protein CDL15_Pgr017949 [Punica granatum]|nr:hypothetical protein CDL15_Pgr017949 [Punica granatum]
MSSEFFTPGTEAELQFNFDDPFFPFGGSTSTIDELLRAITPDGDNHEANSFESQLDSRGLDLCQANQSQPLLANAASFSLPSEGSLQSLAGGGFDQCLPHSYSGESLPDRYFLQRSRSSGCFGETPRPASVQSGPFNGFPNSPDFQRQGTGCSSPESLSSLLGGSMRRVCSTGDLQSPEAMEEASFKVSRYSAEERKERILKYRAKRSQRNFNKTIKYACRKTLADNRPRIRGRFARNDETGDPPNKAASTTTTTTDDDDDDFFWNGLHEEDYKAACGGGPSMTNYGQAQFQFYGY